MIEFLRRRTRIGEVAVRFCIAQVLYRTAPLRANLARESIAFVDEILSPVVSFRAVDMGVRTRYMVTCGVRTSIDHIYWGDNVCANYSEADTGTKEHNCSTSRARNRSPLAYVKNFHGFPLFSTHARM